MIIELLKEDFQGKISRDENFGDFAILMEISRSFKRQIKMGCQSQSGRIGGERLKKTTDSVIVDKTEVKTNEEAEKILFDALL